MESQSVMWYSRGTPHLFRSRGLDWRPKNLRNFLRDFHFSFMSYCWRSWTAFLWVYKWMCVCVWHHQRVWPQREGSALVTSGHTSQVSEKWKLCLLCLSQLLLLFIFLFWRSNFKWPLCLFIIVLGSVAFVASAAVSASASAVAAATAATAAVGITKSLNQLLTTGRVSQPKQQQKVSQVADWARNEVIGRQLRQLR